MNKVFLIGNLTRDPELSTTNSGISVCRISIAVSRRFANADGSRETDFFNVVAWRTIAENCAKYLKKGSKIAVMGSIQNRSYEGNDGNKHYTTDITAEEIEFLSTKGDANASVEMPASNNIPDTGLQPIDDDDNNLPF